MSRSLIFHWCFPQLHTISFNKPKRRECPVTVPFCPQRGMFHSCLLPTGSLLLRRVQGKKQGMIICCHYYSTLPFRQIMLLIEPTLKEIIVLFQSISSFLTITTPYSSSIDFYLVFTQQTLIESYHMPSIILHCQKIVLTPLDSTVKELVAHLGRRNNKNNNKKKNWRFQNIVGRQAYLIENRQAVNRFWLHRKKEE